MEPQPHAVDQRPGEELAALRLQRHVYQLLAGRELRRRRAGLVLLGLLDQFFFLFLFVFGQLLHARRLDHLAGKEHQLRLLGLALGRLEFDQTGLALAEEPGHVHGPGEETLHPEKVILFPVLHERVVVAAGAADVHAEEDDADFGREFVEIDEPLAEEHVRPSGHARLPLALRGLRRLGLDREE